MKYEYGVVHRSDILDDDQVKEIHRCHMTKEEAHQWVDEFVEMGGAESAFSVIKRPVGEWTIET